MSIFITVSLKGTYYRIHVNGYNNLISIDKEKDLINYIEKMLRKYPKDIYEGER